MYKLPVSEKNKLLVEAATNCCSFHRRKLYQYLPGEQNFLHDAVQFVQCAEKATAGHFHQDTPLLCCFCFFYINTIQRDHLPVGGEPMPIGKQYYQALTARLNIIE
jgi:hypothetical protein